jgi:hypothetical protein
MRGRLATSLLLLLALTSATLRAEPPGEAAFARGESALREGRFSDAIAELERLSDLGTRDANASFNRALGYLGRAESVKARDGDLGQAAAGFREAMLLGDDSEETERALEQVRVSIARDRAQRGLDPVVVRPALGRAALQVIPEGVWAVLGLVASLTLAIGLGLRTSDGSAPRGLVGQIASYAGGLLLLLTTGLGWLCADARRNEKEAVIISKEAPMLDAGGVRQKSRALDQDTTTIPEGASIFVGEQRGRLVQVYWGTTEAWLELGQLRVVARDLEL